MVKFFSHKWGELLVGEWLDVGPFEMMRSEEYAVSPEAQPAVSLMDGSDL